MKTTLGTLLRGPAGTAQEVLVELEAMDDPAKSACLGTWFIDAPDQSPAWRHYALSVVHLRQIEGAPPVVFNKEGATHEFVLVALDPGPKPKATDMAGWQWLQPFNLCEQVVLQSDAVAVSLLETCALLVVKGNLWAEPPLSGQVEPWRSRLHAMTTVRGI